MPPPDSGDQSCLVSLSSLWPRLSSPDASLKQQRNGRNFAPYYTRFGRQHFSCSYLVLLTLSSSVSAAVSSSSLSAAFSSKQSWSRRLSCCRLGQRNRGTWKNRTILHKVWPPAKELPHLPVLLLQLHEEELVYLLHVGGSGIFLLLPLLALDAGGNLQV